MADSTKSTVHREPTAFQNFVAGGVGGIVVVLIGHPFDTVKVRSVLLHAGFTRLVLFCTFFDVLGYASEMLRTLDSLMKGDGTVAETTQLL